MPWTEHEIGVWEGKAKSEHIHIPGVVWLGGAYLTILSGFAWFEGGLMGTCTLHYYSLTL